MQSGGRRGGPISTDCSQVLPPMAFPLIHTMQSFYRWESRGTKRPRIIHSFISKLRFEPHPVCVCVHVCAHVCVFSPVDGLSSLFPVPASV